MRSKLFRVLLASFGVCFFLVSIPSLAEENLSDIEKQIAAKDAELEALRQKAEEARAKASDGETAKGIPGLQSLLNTIPRDSQPKDSDDEEGMFARDRANKWIEENLVGKKIEFKDRVHVKIIPTATGGLYTGIVSFAGVKDPSIGDVREVGDEALGNVKCGGLEWKLILAFTSPALMKHELDEAAAKRLKQVDGKVVTVSGKVTTSPNPRVSSSRTPLDIGSARYGDLFFIARRNGYSPPSRRAKVDKSSSKAHSRYLTLHLGTVAISGLDQQAKP